MADLEQTIVDAASGPANATVDGTSAEQHKLTDLIAADQYLAAKAAKNVRGLGLRMQRVAPPGTV